MPVSRSSSRRSIAPAAFLVLAAAACDAPGTMNPGTVLNSQRTTAAISPSADVGAVGLVRSVRAATVRFRSTSKATNAGYAVSSPCVVHPTLGAMGFHWVNNALVDPVFDALQPEAVLYEPNGKGSLKLVAVEYIVIDVGQPAPTFDGKPFNVGGTPVPVPHWSLHVWLHKPNPSGLFASFNPDVSCPT